MKVQFRKLEGIKEITKIVDLLGIKEGNDISMDEYVTILFELNKTIKELEKEINKERLK